MATAVSGTDIRDDVRRRCDLPAFTATSQVSLTDVATFIVDSAADLSVKLRKLDEGYFLQRATLVTTASVPSVSLAGLTPPFFDLRRVQLERSATDIVPVERASVDSWDEDGVNPDSWGSINPTYQLFGQSLQLWPTPNGAYNLRVYYDTGIVFTTALTETAQMAPGWKEWITLDVMRKVRQQQNQPELSAAHSQERDSVFNNLIAGSGPRDTWQPNQVRDLRDGPRTRYRRGWRIP